jgi:hypothetical protein
LVSIAVTKIAAGTVPERGFTEGTRAKRRPQAGFQQLRLYGFPAQAREFGGINGQFTLFIAFNADNHRLQNTAFATIDRHNGAAGRCGKHHAGIFLSSKSACPLMTRSPSCTSIEGAFPDNRRPKWRHGEH